MKQLRIPLIGLFILSTSLVNAEETRCECGTFSTGITSYFMDIGEGQGCCSGTLLSGTLQGAYYTTYILREGVWQLATQTPLQPTAALNKCCPK